MSNFFNSTSFPFPPASDAAYEAFLRKELNELEQLVVELEKRDEQKAMKATNVKQTTRLNAFGLTVLTKFTLNGKLFEVCKFTETGADRPIWRVFRDGDYSECDDCLTREQAWQLCLEYAAE